MAEKTYSKSFTKLTVELNEPRAGFDAYVAVWFTPGHGELLLGAASVEKLAEHWKRLTRGELDRARVQHVMMLECRVPDELWRQAQGAAATAAAVTSATEKINTMPDGSLER